MKTEKEINEGKLLEDAKSKLYQLDLKNSFDLTNKALLEDPTLVEAYRFLSYLYYHFEKDYKNAHELIEKALVISAEEWKTYRLNGVIYNEEKSYHTAIEWYEKALEKLDNEDSEILTLIGECYFELNDSSNAKLFFEKALDNDPMCMKANRILRLICLQSGEYKKSLALFKMDNLIEDNDETKGTIANIIESIEKSVNTIDQKGECGQALSNLGQSYYEAALYEDALIAYKKALSIDSSLSLLTEKVKTIEKYLQITNELKDTMLQIYNQIIHGEKRAIKSHKQRSYSILIKIAPFFGELRKLPININKKAWKKLIEFYKREFKVSINDFFQRKQLYGIYASYIMNEIDFKAEYWGKQGNIKYIDLGRDVTNEFTGWVWKYFNSGIGGWSSEKEKNTIYQVSDAFRGINKYWDIITTPSLLDEWSAKAGEGLCDNKYSVNDVFYSEGLGLRFLLKYINSVYNYCKTEYSMEKEQQKYFLKKYYEYKNQTLLFSHESQHAIDLKSVVTKFNILLYSFKKRTGGFNAALEYRAKLTELYYGENPFVSLNIIMSRDIGGSSPHGRANTKIFKKFVEYVQEHTSDFPEINTTKNILLQLDKLEIDQIRAIAKYAFE